MTYEQLPSITFTSLEEEGLTWELPSDIPPGIRGMNALDFEPDLDDYEYLQSIY